MRGPASKPEFILNEGFYRITDGFGALSGTDTEDVWKKYGSMRVWEWDLSNSIRGMAWRCPLEPDFWSAI
jgi:hypothetical protein